MVHRRRTPARKPQWVPGSHVARPGMTGVDCYPSLPPSPCRSRSAAASRRCTASSPKAAPALQTDLQDDRHRADPRAHRALPRRRPGLRPERHRIASVAEISVVRHPERERADAADRHGLRPCQLGDGRDQRQSTSSRISSPACRSRKGTAFVFKSYDRTSQRFSNIRAARDAEIQDAKELSEQLHLRIAAALNERRQGHS